MRSLRRWDKRISLLSLKTSTETVSFPEALSLESLSISSESSISVGIVEFWHFRVYWYTLIESRFNWWFVHTVKIRLISTHLSSCLFLSVKLYSLFLYAKLYYRLKLCLSFKLFIFICYRFSYFRFRWSNFCYTQARSYFYTFIHSFGIAHISSILYCTLQIRPILVGTSRWPPTALLILCLRWSLTLWEWSFSFSIDVILTAQVLPACEYKLELMSVAWSWVAPWHLELDT